MTLSLRHRQPQVVPSFVANSDSEPGPAVPSALAFQKIDELIEQLAAAGALDEGNKRALDGLIASWRAQHQEALTAFYLDRAGSRDERMATLRAMAKVVSQRLDSAKRHLEMIERSGPAPDPDGDGPVTLEPGAAEDIPAHTTEQAA
jgi:hypothetical protein